MNTYFILHPADGSMNHTDSIEGIIFHCVGSVEADSLNYAFMQAQNDFSDYYKKFNVRSTSVGDIIVENNYNFNLVKGMGFQIVDNVAIANKKIQPIIELHGDMANEFNNSQGDDDEYPDFMVEDSI